MSRKKMKMKLQLMGNKAARRQTFRKRKSCLVKKAGELSVLCDVQAVMIIHSPYEHGIQIWPSKEEASSLLRRFLSMPSYERKRHGMDQEAFLRQQINVLSSKVEKEEKKNQELELEYLVGWFLGCGERALKQLTYDELSHLHLMVEAKLEEVQATMNALLLHQQTPGGFLCHAAVEGEPNNMLPHGLPSFYGSVEERIRALSGPDWQREMMTSPSLPSISTLAPSSSFPPLMS
ncbi:unnamed protein product [Spirodela intermedia]|uniref:MADS-box domain-containing protein n=2 Tax=Spirodela intermedia TaxID=51605 RepID=A0A7I8KDQ9_SPIIN|nr:unnamed protein product [Spirodela intermedia]CAA6658944.1 unnamed protein product [Spirodela intermedia]CAA7395228.1 unnamed protein product [Spirodela intermedia]